MRVQSIMRKDVLTLPLGTTLRDAARLLAERGVSGSPVVDADGRIVGVVSEKDLFRALYPSEQEFVAAPEAWADDADILTRAHEAASRHVDEVMTRDVVAVTPDTSLVRVGALMLARGLHRVLVMDGGKLKGIVSRHDVYRKVLQRELRV